MFEKIIYLIPSYIAAGMPCLFHEVTGLYCPGCGGTRSVHCFLQGHFLLSVIYHPLVMYCAILGFYLVLRHVLHGITAVLQKKKTTKPPSSKGKNISYLKDWMLWAMLGIVIANFLIKNIALIFFHIDLLP